MSVRVLSSDQGKASISKLQAIVSGGLSEQISALKAEGQILSDPNVWDGVLAEDFRANTWPSAASALDQTAQALEELRARVQTINTDIMSAGGNAY
jgi:uncharacterized protein YukE